MRELFFSSNYQLIPYTGVLLVSALVLLGILLITWRRRGVPGGRSFIILMAIMITWSLANALEMMGSKLDLKLFWANVQYICYSIAPATLLALTLQYTGRERWLTRRRLILLMIIPSLTVVIAWTNWGGLLRRDVFLDSGGPFPVVGKTYGPWFWVHLLYNYSLVVVSFIIHIKAMWRRHRLYQWQSLALLTGFILPIPLNLAFTFKVSPYKFDLAPTLLTVAGAFYAIGLFRYRLFDILPAGRDMVIESMGDAMLTLDGSNRIVDFNPAATKLLGITGALIGKTATDTFINYPGLEELFQTTDRGHQEISIGRPEQDCHYIVRWWPIMDRRGRLNGRLLIFQDITDVKAVQEEVLRQQRFAAVLEERERLARELHDSQGQVMGYLNIQLQALRDQLADGQIAAVGGALARLSQIVEEANTEIREFIYEIKTPLLFKEGFLTALEHYAARFGADFQIKVTVENPDQLRDEALSLPAQAQLFRIIQEALTNIRKHAQADRVTIALAKTGGKIRVVVADNGRGFNSAGLSRQKHFGLEIMRERAVQAGGVVQIKANPESGTEVVVELPCCDAQVIPAPVTAIGEAPDRVNTSKLRLLLADDHALFLDGLQNLLNSKGFQIVATAKTGWEALEKARIFRPDLILMDIQMPDCGGLMATRLIKAELPELRIVILSMSDREKDLYEAMRSGASGYLLKGLRGEELVARLFGFIRGETPLSPELAGRVWEELKTANEAAPVAADAATAQTFPTLTRRQSEVLRLVAQGWIYREIARQLSVSERTVKFHMGEIIKRLHLKNRAEVEAYARRIKLEKGRPISRGDDMKQGETVH
jgi:PAS domain S-box-containing protein